jgi:hypothetical protein
MKKIASLFLRGASVPDPDDQFRAFAPCDLAPRARQELNRMRQECSTGSKPYPGQCDECPGRSHPRCCWNLD